MPDSIYQIHINTLPGELRGPGRHRAAGEGGGQRPAASPVAAVHPGTLALFPPLITPFLPSFVAHWSAETKYTWADWTKVVHPPEPKRVRQRFPAWLRGGKATKIDLHYKARAGARGGGCTSSLLLCLPRPAQPCPPAPPRPAHGTHMHCHPPPLPPSLLPPQTGKTDDWEREDFDFVRHSKIGFFSSVIGVVAIPAMFRCVRGWVGGGGDLVGYCV